LPYSSTVLRRSAQQSLLLAIILKAIFCQIMANGAIISCFQKMVDLKSSFLSRNSIKSSSMIIQVLIVTVGEEIWLKDYSHENRKE
jgi:hypothetical protein